MTLFLRWKGIVLSELATAGILSIDGPKGEVRMMPVDRELRPSQKEILEAIGQFCRDWKLVQQDFLYPWQVRFYPFAPEFLLEVFAHKVPPALTSQEWEDIEKRLSEEVKISLYLRLGSTAKRVGEKYLHLFMALNQWQRARVVENLSAEFLSASDFPQKFWKAVEASGKVYNKSAAGFQKEIDPSILQPLIQQNPDFLCQESWPHLPKELFPASLKRLSDQEKSEFSLRERFWRSFDPQQMTEKEERILEGCTDLWPELKSLAHLTLMPFSFFSKALSFAHEQQIQAENHRGRIWSYLRNKIPLGSPQLLDTLGWIQEHPEFIESTYLTMRFWYGDTEVAKKIIALMYQVPEEDFLPFLQGLKLPDLRRAISEYQYFAENSQGQISMSPGSDGKLSQKGS